MKGKIVGFCLMFLLMGFVAEQSFGQDLKKTNLLMMLSVQSKDGGDYSTQIVNDNIGKVFATNFNNIASKKGFLVNFIEFSKDFDPEQEFDIIQIVVKFDSDVSFMFNGRKFDAYNGSRNMKANSAALSLSMKKLKGLMQKLAEVEYDSKEYNELCVSMKTTNIEASDEMFEVATDIIAFHH